MESRYFIGIGLPPKAESIFNHVKRTFHPQHRLTSPAHITLVPPFYWTNHQLLVSQLTKLASQFQSFTAKFTRIASFKQLKYGTVFLAPNQVAPFKHLALTLQQAILGQAYRGEFKPHLTLAQKVPHDQLTSVKQQIREMNLSLKLKVDRLTLFSFNDQVWVKHQTFPFSNLNSQTKVTREGKAK